MSAVLKKKYGKQGKRQSQKSIIEVASDDEEAFRIDGELEFPVFSTNGAARLLEMDKNKVSRALAAAGTKARKTLVYPSGKKVPGYFMADIHRALVRAVEQSFLEPTKPQRDMHPEKYGNPRGKVTEELRLTKARADKAELELAEAAGDLISISQVVQDVGDMLASFRARLIGAAPKFAANLPPDLRSEAEAHARGFINEALEEIAQYKPRVHRSAGADDEAAAGAQGK